MGTRGVRVAVVYGGLSAEREVSQVTSTKVAEALRGQGYETTRIELTPDIGAALLAWRPDVVFPACHGPFGEDGCLQGVLEIARLPYVGSDVLASALAMNKVQAKRVWLERGLPTPDYVVVDVRQTTEERKATIQTALGDRVVVKPVALGSAVGVTLVHSPDRLTEALELALRYGPSVLVERLHAGKEITCGVLDQGDQSEALPVIEITTPRGWYDYVARYTPGLSEHIIPARLPAAVGADVQRLAVAAHRTLGCRDFSRVDFVVPEKGAPQILEVNTIPGMTPTSLYPDAAKAAGLSFGALVDHLVQQALRRGVASGSLQPQSGPLAQ